MILVHNNSNAHVILMVKYTCAFTYITCNVNGDNWKDGGGGFKGVNYVHKYILNTT